MTPTKKTISSPWKTLVKLLEFSRKALGLVWGFTDSDFFTFVVPNTIFGLSGFFILDDVRVSDMDIPLNIYRRMPLVILFNWSNLLIFDIANQRSPKSVQEDLVNKPWRPIPTNKITSEQARVLLALLIPLVLFINFLLGVWQQTTLLFILTWLYNDLAVGDSLARNVVIAFAFAVYNEGSVTVATRHELTPQAYIWIAMVSGIILTTMQMQDFKDQPGDRLRGRKTLPLTMGDGPCRLVTSIFIVAWSIICTQYWIGTFWFIVLSTMFSLALAYRLLSFNTFKADARSWRLWCLWTAYMYMLPVIRSVLSIETSIQ